MKDRRNTEALHARLADLERRLAAAEAHIRAYDTAWAAIAPPSDPPRPVLRLIPGRAASGS